MPKLPVQIKKSVPISTPIPEKRPVLRMFECLMHLEQAKIQLDMVGITTGKYHVEMDKHRADARASLAELIRLYSEYWKSIVDLGDNNA